MHGVQLEGIPLCHVAGLP